MISQTSIMETLLLEDLSSWDPIGDLLWEEDLLPSALSNWENELGLGSEYQAKDPIEKRVELSEFDLSTAPIPDLEISNGLLDEWMEEKIDLNFVNCDNLLENGDPILEKVWTGINKVLDDEGVTETSLTTKSESVEVPFSESQNVTPPESPDRPETELTLDLNSTISGSSIDILVVSVTPPDTPPDYINVELDETTSVTPSSNSKPSSRKRKHSNETSLKMDSRVKKLRKRDQNRDAATRYRLKKRAETEGLCNQESALEEKNKELKDRVDGLSSEIKYLKGLLKEVILAKLA